MQVRGGWAAFGALAIAVACGTRALDPTDAVDAGVDYTIGTPRPDAGADRPAGPCPVTQAPAGRFAFLSAGNDGTCGLQSDGTLICWGFFWGYQQPTFTDTYKYVSRNLSVCALHPRGEIGCWGDPRDVGAPPAGAFDYVVVGESAGCALASITGLITCWGGAGYAPGDNQFRALTGGAYSMCALDRVEHAVCWDPRVGAETVVVVPGPFTAITTGRFFACGLRADGNVSCWATSNMYPDPEILGRALDGPFTEISAGDLHVCALKPGGAVVCWGENAHGQGGPPAGLRLAHVSSGSTHSCGIQFDGTVVCWGGSDACGS